MDAQAYYINPDLLMCKITWNLAGSRLVSGRLCKTLLLLTCMCNYNILMTVPILLWFLKYSFSGKGCSHVYLLYRESPVQMKVIYQQIFFSIVLPFFPVKRVNQVNTVV